MSGIVTRPVERLTPVSDSRLSKFYSWYSEHHLESGIDPLTIVITNWQRPQKLKRCAESVLRAGFTRFVISCAELSEEVLQVVENLVAAYPEISVVLSRVDRGCNELWLQGAYAARSPYVLLLHDDDQLAPDFRKFYESWIRPQLLRKVGAVLWNGQVENSDRIISGVIKQFSGSTRLVDSKERIQPLLERGVNAVSPVVQIFQRQILIRTLKECEANFSDPVFFTKPTMLLGNEVLLALRSSYEFPDFFYLDEVLSWYGSWEGSETTLHGRAGSKALVAGYDAARSYFEKYPSSHSFAPPSRTIHVRNKKICRQVSLKYQALYEEQGWIPHPEFTPSMFDTSARIKRGHEVALPEDKVSVGPSLWS